MGMFAAMARFVKAIGYVVTLQFLWASKKIEDRPEIVGLQYDDVIKNRAQQARIIKDAIGGLIAQQETCKERMGRLTGDVEQLEKERAGAKALASERVAALKAQGLAAEAIKADGEFTQLQAAYADASSTLEAKTRNITDLENQINAMEQSIGNYQIQLQNMQRELERLRAERHEAVADMTLSRALDGVNEALAGISGEGTEHLLSELRQRRAEAHGRAVASQKLAGTDVTVQREKLLKAAASRVHDKEFMEGLGLDAAAPAKTEAAVEKDAAPQLPEGPVEA